MEITNQLIADKPRELGEEITALLNKKYDKQNQRIICGLLFTNPTTYRLALRGKANDLLLFRMTKFNMDGFNNKPLVKLVNKHFSDGVNGLSI